MRFILALLCLVAGAGGTAAADLKLLTTSTFQPAALALLPEFERRTGHKVKIEIATANNFDGRMDADEYFDVVVMTARLLDPYLGSRVVVSSATPVARAGLGVAVKQGMPLPDISGIGAFRKTMLAARAVAYIDPASGASNGTVLVGPIPLELQNYTLYLGGVSTVTRHRTAADELLSILADRKNNALFRTLGLSES